MDFIDEDIELMLRFQSGDEACFERLAELHKDRVFNMACRFLGDYQEAEDTTQEVFLKIYRAKNIYRPQAKFTTWLYIICKNTCLKALDKKHPGTVSLDGIIELEEDAAPMQAADPSSPSPVDSMVDSEAASVIKAAIDSLPPSQRMAVILCRYERLSYEEAAAVMLCSVKAVKSMLHRARVGLKEKLAAYFKK